MPRSAWHMPQTSAPDHRSAHRQALASRPIALAAGIDLRRRRGGIVAPIVRPGLRRPTPQLPDAVAYKTERQVHVLSPIDHRNPSSNRCASLSGNGKVDGTQMVNKVLTKDGTFPGYLRFVGVSQREPSGRDSHRQGYPSFHCQNIELTDLGRIADSPSWN